MRAVTIFDALRVKIVDGSRRRHKGGRCEYRWPLLWAECVVAASSVGATPHQRRCPGVEIRPSITLATHIHVAGKGGRISRAAVTNTIYVVSRIPSMT
jgi:hypothetical protein